MIRVLLAEDHVTVREGLSLLLNAQGDMEVVGVAENGRTAIEEAQRLAPDVVVLDLSMPEVSGLEAAATLRQLVPAAAIVALTRHNDEAYVRQMETVGAAAYVLKQSSSATLLTAIRTAASGGRFKDPALPADAVLPARGGAKPAITGRETAVLRMMSVGQSNKQIAASLGISVKTVEVHKANGMRKLNLSGRADVVKYAALQGWLKDP
jgi:DNA-binding NarL/FixJ family response regulator